MPSDEQCLLQWWCELPAGHGQGWCQLTIAELRHDQSDTIVHTKIVSDDTHRRTRVLITATFDNEHATPYGVVPATWRQVDQLIDALQSAQRHSHQRGW